MWPHELGPSGHQQLLFAAQVGLQAAISRMESNKIVQKTYWRWWGLDSKWCSIAFYYSFVSGHPKTHHCWWAKVCVVNRHRQDSSTENIKKNTLSNANEMPWNAPSSHEIQWCNIDMTSSEHHIYIYNIHYLLWLNQPPSPSPSPWPLPRCCPFAPIAHGRLPPRGAQRVHRGVVFDVLEDAERITSTAGKPRVEIAGQGGDIWMC